MFIPRVIVTVNRVDGDAKSAKRFRSVGCKIWMEDRLAADELSQLIEKGTQRRQQVKLFIDGITTGQ